MRRAAIYARISSDPSGERLGVGRQIADCERRAADLGWTVYDTYVDNDTSAWSGKTRPEYRRLCEDIKAGVVDGLVVWHADRLHRHPRELEDFVALCDAAGDVAIQTVTAGELDLSDSTGRAVARILGAVARKESDDKSARIRRKHAELAAAGKVAGGGTRPFGYTADRLHVVADEAALVREAARRVLAGESLRSVCADLNERGAATSTGGAWSVQSLGRMLGSARISGRREHHGQVVADAVWPPIIPAADSDRLRARLGRAAAAAPAGRTARRYLLTGGLLRCGLCGTPMVSRPRSDGTRRYVCARGPGFGGCGRMATVAEPVEALVAEAVLQRLDTPELAAALADVRQADAEADQLHGQVAADDALLDQLAADLGARRISHREWMAARQPIQTRIDSARRRLSRISPTQALDDYAGHSQVLRDAWADLPLTRQQAIIRLILDHVVVSPAVKGRNTFDLSRFHPVWRL
ncbi:MAG: recombinase family protein [Acidimicrobiia bacterium]|jgi:DNA invertase Pin-like site-specific DNA recombinase|nr:recombinase family protein [Acidimicrobiia bacterium]